MPCLDGLRGIAILLVTGGSFARSLAVASVEREFHETPILAFARKFKYEPAEETSS